MGKHLQKFMLQADIETAVDDGTLVKPYIAIYGTNYEHIDWNTYVHVITFDAGDIYTTSICNDVVESEWVYASGTQQNITRVYFDNLTPEMQAFVNNPRNYDLNRWHLLTSENTFSGLLKNSFYMNEPLAIKYDSTNNILRVIPDNDKYLTAQQVGQISSWLYNNNINAMTPVGESSVDYRFNVLAFNLTTKDILPEYFVGLENNNSKLVLGTHEESIDSTITEYAENLPSIFFTYIDNYSNGTYDGSEVNISSENISIHIPELYNSILGEYVYNSDFMNSISRYISMYDESYIINVLTSATVQSISMHTINNYVYLYFKLSGTDFNPNTHHFEIDLSSFTVDFYEDNSSSGSGSGSGY